MPLLAYFTVVGSVLVGLLYVAEAQLGPPKSLSVSTDFYGLPQPWKPESVAILTVREAPAPPIAKSEAAKTAAKTTVGQSAEAASALAKAEAAPVETAPAKERAKERKVKRANKTAPKTQRNLFAQGAPAGKNHGVVW